MRWLDAHNSGNAGLGQLWGGRLWRCGDCGHQIMRNRICEKTGGTPIRLPKISRRKATLQGLRTMPSTRSEVAFVRFTEPLVSSSARYRAAQFGALDRAGETNSSGDSQ